MSSLGRRLSAAADDSGCEPNGAECSSVSLLESRLSLPLRRAGVVLVLADVRVRECDSSSLSLECRSLERLFAPALGLCLTCDAVAAAAAALLALLLRGESDVFDG